MDSSLEYPDDGLRERIRKGFEDNTTNKSKKIEERPKTPRKSRKNKGCVTIPKKVTVTPDKKEEDHKKEKQTFKKKPGTDLKSALKKTVNRKAKPVTENVTKKLKHVKPVSEKSFAKQGTAVYLCPKCDRTYKSKHGIIKHMQKCV